MPSARQRAYSFAVVVGRLSQCDVGRRLLPFVAVLSHRVLFQAATAVGVAHAALDLIASTEPIERVGFAVVVRSAADMSQHVEW